MSFVPVSTAEPPSRALAFAGEGLIELTLDGARSALDCGGDAANAATMSALLGGPVRLLGRVGDDALGRRLLDFWCRRGLDTSAVLIDDEAPTGLYVNELPAADRNASRIFTYWRRDSAGSRWSSADLQHPGVLSDMAAIVVTAVTASISASCEEAVWHLVEHARTHSVPAVCVLNYRAPLHPDRATLARLAAAVDIVIASTDDLAYVLPGRSPEDMLKLARHSGRELVVTEGPAGASVAWSEGIVRQGVSPVPVRDTVGAGDALAGAYVWARFALGHPPAEALAWGVAAAQLSVQRDGCASSYPDAAETAAARERLPRAQPYQRLHALGD
jgi:2-dehydro-3-deoxygluconokinase